MAQLYQLIPLPQGYFEGLSLVDRAIFGLIYDRLKLSVNNHLSSIDGGAYLDDDSEVFCLYSQEDMAAVCGVSVRTVRRSVAVLVEKGLIRTRKVRYQDSNRYYIPYAIREALRPQQRGQIVTPIRSNFPLNEAKLSSL